MNFRKINIRHASGVYTLQVKSKEFDTVHKKITGIIKGKNKQFVHSSRDGAMQVFPAEMLRQSVVTFEPQKESSGLIQS